MNPHRTIDEDAPLVTHGSHNDDGTTAEIQSHIEAQSLTGLEVLEILAKKRQLGELEFLYLQKTQDGPYRPYDLHVVPQCKTDSDHYIFSPTSVMHLQNGCCVELLTLAEWHREAVLWRALRDIPFFREYMLRRFFARWRRNVRQLVFQRKGDKLRDQLLMAVPCFREALFQLFRKIEGLKKDHWLPQDDSKTYTLLDFQTALLKVNKDSRQSLQTFLQHRAQILNKVKNHSFAAREEIQVRVAQLPQHVQISQRSDLRMDLARTDSVLHRLGNFGTLVDCVIVQNLVTITHHEINTFFSQMLERDRPQQGGLFLTELMFGSDNHLTLFPPIHLFEEVLNQAISSVADSTLQVLESCSSQDLRSSSAVPDVPETTDENSVSGVSSPDLMHDPVITEQARVVSRTLHLIVHGRRLQGHYYPLSQQKLEWQLKLSDGTQDLLQDQTTMMQEAGFEIHRLCESYSWLVDIGVFIRQWNVASLEAMRGWPSVKYKESIQKLHRWEEQIHAMAQYFTTANKLLTVDCSHMQKTIGPLLRSIDNDVLTLLTEELQLRTQMLVSELKRAEDDLRVQPTDFRDFILYASLAKHWEEKTEYMQKKQKYLNSLQETICTNYRQLTLKESEEELHLTDLWEHIRSLMEQAAVMVRKNLPSMSETLDKTHLYLRKEAEVIVSDVTSCPYLDPKQDAAQMLANLKALCRRMSVVSVELKEISQASQILRGVPISLTFMETAAKKTEGRKELWELMTVSVAQIQKWKQMKFHKFVVAGVQKKVNEWLQQVASLSASIPSEDMVLQKTLQVIDEFNHQLSVLHKLCSPALKPKHYTHIMKGLGMQGTAEMTVGELMSQNVIQRQSDVIKICSEAEAEADMEQNFKSLQQCWEGMQFQLAKFAVTMWLEDKFQTVAAPENKTSNMRLSCSENYVQDSDAFIIIGLESLLARTEDSLMTLSNMLLSPYSAEFGQDVDCWIQMLQELEELFDFCQRFQQKWVFLSKMFYGTSGNIVDADLLETFQSLGIKFQEMTLKILIDPHVLNFVRPKTNESNCHFCGSNLRKMFTNGLSIMDKISSRMHNFLDYAREEFPRLCFLSDDEVIKLLSLNPMSSALLALARKSFQGICSFKVASTGDMHEKHNLTNDYTGPECSDSNLLLLGVFGALKEYVPFLQPLEPNINPFHWLGLLEQKLQQTMMQLLRKCMIAYQQCGSTCHYQESTRDNLSPDPSHFTSPTGKEKETEFSGLHEILNLIPQFPVQCLLVCEEAMWCKDIRNSSMNSDGCKWTHVKARNSAKLQHLCHAIQNRISERNGQSVVSNQIAALRALVLLTMKHSQQLSGLSEIKHDLETSFEWQKIMKYYIPLSDDPNQSGHISQTESINSDLSCYVDVMGSQLKYGYEYMGPENWMMVSTPCTDRAILGILLALTSYRGTFLSGPCMSGKRTTVLQLGQALGRQVITLRCTANTSPSVVQQMLLGALQTGSWLVLESVESMTHRVLSLLGQHLADIHDFFLPDTSDLTPQALSEDSALNKEKEHWTKGSTEDPIKKDNRSLNVCQVSFAGKTILPDLSYGCVITSSCVYSVAVPENLRVATRPVSLTLPDYQIIMKVMILTHGFTETSISHQLMSLFTLARGSVCLPDSISDRQTSWLVLLKKVIAVSSTYLHAARLEAIKKDILYKEEAVDVGKSDGIVTEQASLQTKQSAKIVNALVEEQAVVKGVLSVLLPAIFQVKKASQFCKIVEEIFPTALCLPVLNQLIGQNDCDRLKEALTKELHKNGLHADASILQNALALFHALKVSCTVLLVGPAGSGKTTCIQSLAGALCKLANEETENPCNTRNSNEAACQFLRSGWSFVHRVTLFPNALSHDELFGGYNGQWGSWMDGGFTKLLRDSENQDLSGHLSIKEKTQTVKWVVLDGEPHSRPGWLDSFSSLGNLEDAHLSLSSGQKVHLSRENIRILAEVSDLSNAAPSAVTRCSIMYISGENVWMSLWKVEMEALCKGYVLENETITIWSCMAEDLFSVTLRLLKNNGLASAMANNRGQPRDGVTYGLQEIMSFFRILHALLQQNGPDNTNKQDGHCTSLNAPSDSICLPRQHNLQNRNMFALAYVWGFGGHLHPRHWPQFDLLARKALHECRYKVEVPSDGLVFDHFMNIKQGGNGDTINTHNCYRITRPQLTFRCIPQYESYACLLRLLLDNGQSTLLVGETGSGKTKLCQSLLNGHRSYWRLALHSCLPNSELRKILESVQCQKSTGIDRKKPELILFVDDLHEASCDPSGKTSMVLETLRQSISKGGVFTANGYHFKLFGSGVITYLGTCSPPGPGNGIGNQISSRFSRLFSILVLPPLTDNILFSIHSPTIQNWLREYPFTSKLPDLAECIITATLDFYHAVGEHFPSCAARPHFLFSLHDIQKVFRGMMLSNPAQQKLQANNAVPEPTANMLSIIRLWMHECMRTFGDRFCAEEDVHSLQNVLAQTSERHFSSVLSPEITTDKEVSPMPADSCLHVELLKDMGATIHQVIFGPELSEPLNTIAQQQRFKHNSLYQERDLNSLVQKLVLMVKSIDIQDEKNFSGIPSHAVHSTRVCQLFHILRALLMPGGHGVLFSTVKGTGRKTLVRLTARLTGYQLIEVHSGNENRFREMLKEAGIQSGVLRLRVIFMVHQNVGQDVRDFIQAVMAEGTFPGLYSNDELMNVALKIKELVKTSHWHTGDNQALENYFRNIRRNMHVFLLLPLLRNSADGTVQDTSVISAHRKALSLSCCVEVYWPWNTKSLMEIASYHLKDSLPGSDIKADEDGLARSISFAMASIHQSAVRFASFHLGHTAFSPGIYMELMKHIFYISDHLCQQGQIQATRLATVLGCVKEMMDTTECYGQEILRLKKHLNEKQECLSHLNHELEVEHSLFKRSHQECLHEQYLLSHQKKQSQLAHQQVQDAFRRVSPLHKLALEALQSLRESDLDEVRRYRYPPEGLMVIVEAVCLLFNRPPDWESCRQIMSQPNFLQKLESYDPNLSDTMLQDLALIVETLDFLPEAVRSKSQACESLCHWVRAVYKKACFLRNMASQMGYSKKLDEQVVDMQRRLRVAQQREEAARERLENLKHQHQVVSGEIKELTNQLARAKMQERSAKTTVQQVECYTAEWNKAKGLVKRNNQTVSGDALILAASVTYLGPFGPDVRRELLAKWHDLCVSGIINVSPEDPRASLLSGLVTAPPQCPPFVPIPVNTQLQDTMARVLGLRLQHVEVPPRLLLKLLIWGCYLPPAKRCTLLADIDQHEDFVSQTILQMDQLPQEGCTFLKEDEFGLVVSATDPDLLKTLGQRAEKGLSVLVTHVECLVPCAELMKFMVRSVGNGAPVHPVPPTHPEFRLFLSTALPVHSVLKEIHPLILDEVQIIDMSLSTSELKEFILADLVQSHSPGLCVQLGQLKAGKQMIQEKMHKEEVSLTEYILHSITPLLQDHQFLARVLACQETSEKLKADIAAINKKLELYNPLLTDFRSLAGLAASFYQALQEVARLSPFYLFTLRGFLLSLHGLLDQKALPDVDEISLQIASHLLAQYRPCLFQNHATVLKLLFSVNLFLKSEGCSEVERVAFLRGLSDIHPPEWAFPDPLPALKVTQATNHELLGWIPHTVYHELQCLEEIPAFQGLMRSLKVNSQLWQQYLHFPSSTVTGPVPCQSHAHLCSLQRALLWKTLVPNSLSAVAEDLAACQLDQLFFSSSTQCAKALSSLSRNKDPVIINLPDFKLEVLGGMDPLYWLKQVAHADNNRIKFKVISFGNACEKEKVLTALKEAVQDGHWLVLNNCHLLDEWDEEVVSQISKVIPFKTNGHRTRVEEGLLTSDVGSAIQVHPVFRLWFVTKGQNPLTIPAVVRMNSIRLVCDSSWDLREELCSSLSQVVSFSPPVLTHDQTWSMLEPALRCAVLHSVLQQRQMFRHLGHGAIYSWTQEDLLALTDAYNHICKPCNDPFGALEFIAAQLVYGGHVTDSVDLETINMVARACLKPAPPSWGRGPHTLSEAIIGSGQFDRRRMMQRLEHCIYTIPISSDPTILGFSSGLAVEQVRVQSNMLRILLHQSQSPSSEVRRHIGTLSPRTEMAGYMEACERLQALQKRLKYRQHIGEVVAIEPLHCFLKMEWEDLVETVSVLLTKLSCPGWNGTSSVTVHNLSRLEKQAELLISYLWEGSASHTPKIYCLSAFQNPKGFLDSLIRSMARAERKDVSHMSFHYQVLGASVSSLHTNGIYLCGLELHGAIWDTSLGALQSTLSSKSCPIPLLWVRPCMMVNSPVQSPGSDSSLPLYKCPLYLDRELEAGSWGLSEQNIVTYIPLAAKLDPLLCVLRRVRLVSTLYPFKK
ncbi:dynein heavy chain domain-containing protein 1-like [Denticeps clupeoides]|uniref:dynein heavy chain domain-containing protein 1-like n=1 Tax=Denticeps clupeoides TaxID=299321 RepID=UPI0010A31DA4|nr:dynein heavy chain domain-containing protein 1-like [Denticeps clupeoides]